MKKVIRVCAVDLKPVSPRRKRSRYCSQKCKQVIAVWRIITGKVA